MCVCVCGICRYVDEPTTGLDSVMATNVVQQLKAMASGSSNNQNTGNLKQQQSRQLRTVLCTIHQPSSEIYKLFDKLYFVVDGRAAFFGNTADVPAYFTRMGYPMAVGSERVIYYMGCEFVRMRSVCTSE